MKFGRIIPTARLIASRAINSASQFAILILISRGSTLAEFGSYSSLLGIGAVLSGFLGLGLVTRALRSKAETIEGLPGSFLATTITTSAISAIVIAALSSALNSNLSTFALAAAAFIASEMINNLIQSLLFGSERNRAAEFVILSRRLTPLAVVAAGFFLFQADVFTLAAVGYSATVLVSLLALGRVRWTGWHLRAVFHGSRHYWLSNIWSMGQQVDVTIVGAISGLQSAAGYSAAFRLASPIHLVTSTITSMLIPRLSSAADAQSRLNSGRPFVTAALSYAAIVAALSPLAGIAGPWLFGPEYAQFAVIFAIFFINNAISVVNQMQAALLYGEGMDRAVSTSTAVGTIFGLTFVALGAATGGLLWASIGYATSRAILSLVLFAFWRRRPDKYKSEEDGDRDE